MRNGDVQFRCGHNRGQQDGFNILRDCDGNFFNYNRFLFDFRNDLVRLSHDCCFDLNRFSLGLVSQSGNFSFDFLSDRNDFSLNRFCFSFEQICDSFEHDVSISEIISYIVSKIILVVQNLFFACDLAFFLVFPNVPALV